MAFPITSAGILVHDNRDNYWLTLEKSGKISIPGGQRDKGEGIRACAIRETSEETLDAIRSIRKFKSVLYPKVDKKTVKEFHFSDALNKAIFVTYIVKVDLHKDHDPAKTFADRKNDPKLKHCQKEVEKLIPVKRADLLKLLESDRPKIDGKSVRFCVAKSLKEAVKQKLIA